MPNQPVPEESVEAAFEERMGRARRTNSYTDATIADLIRRQLAAAAPAIRKQERERVRAALLCHNLIDWHDRRAKVKRLNAEQESDPTSRATLLGNADTHDVAAAVARRVLEGESLDGEGK